MGKSASKVLYVNTTVTKTSITFIKHEQAEQQIVYFRNGASLTTIELGCLSPQSHTISGLTPNESYSYFWATTEKDCLPTNFIGEKRISTLPNEPSENANLDLITGPYEAIFSISEQEVQSIEKVIIEVFNPDGLLHGTYELTPLKRFVKIQSLLPGTLYTSYYRTKKTDEKLISSKKRKEFYSKKCRDLNEILQNSSNHVSNSAKIRCQLANFKPPDGAKYANILCLGQIGAGKSSVINSIASALEESYTILTNTGVSPTSLTQNVHYLRLTKAPGINLVDLFGFDYTKHQVHSQLVGHLLNGRVRHMSKLEDIEKHFFGDRNDEGFTLDTDGSKTKLRQISGIIVVIDPKTMMDDEWMNQLSVYFNHIIKLGVPYVVLLTQIDTIFKNEEFNIKDVFTHPKVCELMNEFSKKMGRTFPVESVFPYVSDICSTATRNPAKDYYTLTILHEIVKHSGNYLKKLNEEDEFM